MVVDLDGGGDADDALESLCRTLANEVYSAINEQGTATWAPKFTDDART